MISLTELYAIQAAEAQKQAMAKEEAPAENAAPAEDNLEHKGA